MAIAELVRPFVQESYQRQHNEQARFLGEMNAEQLILWKESASIYHDIAAEYTPRRFWNFQLPLRALRSRMAGFLF